MRPRPIGPTYNRWAHTAGRQPALRAAGSGKIVRRAIKAVLTGGDPGDLSTLANPESLGPLRQVVADRSTNG